MTGDNRKFLRIWNFWEFYVILFYFICIFVTAIISKSWWAMIGNSSWRSWEFIFYFFHGHFFQVMTGDNWSDIARDLFVSTGHGPAVCVCCRVLQCVAVCCSVLQCVALCCSVLREWQSVCRHRIIMGDDWTDICARLVCAVCVCVWRRWLIEFVTLSPTYTLCTLCRTNSLFYECWWTTS